MPFRFIHTADIHLDSPLRSLAMRNGELAELVGDATRQALIVIVDLCIDEQVDALVIAGDLYDGDQTSMKTARFLASQMQRLHEVGIATFIIRGNHDALSRITQELILPPSVTVFGGRAHAVELARGDLALSIHGLSFAKPHAPDSLLEGIAKLFDVDCKSGDFSQSGRHLGGITVPQAEGIGSGMTVGDGGKSIAAGAEDDADLVVGSKEPLRLPRRFEPSHDLFPSPRRPV